MIVAGLDVYAKQRLPGAPLGSIIGAHRKRVAAGNTDFFEILDGSVLLKKLKRRAEVSFYQELSSSNNILRKIVPEYFGHLTTNCGEYIALEDLTHGLNRPCVIDLKLGKHRRRDIRALCGSMLKVKGAIFFDGNGHLVHQDFRRAWTNFSVAEARAAFDLVMSSFPNEALEKLRTELDQLRFVVLGQERFHFEDSSLLIVWDAAASGECCLRIALIDFDEFSQSHESMHVGFEHLDTWLPQGV